MQVQEDKPYDDINITPMLDLAYVLLVIFILMCTAAVQGAKVNLPSESKTQSLAKPKTQAVSISNEGKMTLNNIPISSLDDLSQKLQQIRAKVPDCSVVLKGDAKTSYQAISDVLDVVGKLGITQVGLATRPQSGK
ncbi:MAG TPA: biopolymer transporter ExbD [Chthoniobacteraceae bacterium]|nr:biopolymer transporter ExbD [Chthoniobacteraceae bacterium]